MTEKEIRNQVIKTAGKYIGCGNKNIVDIYNGHKPLARGYKVKYTDAWCAAFVSAVSIVCGLTDIMPTECGCPKMISLYKALGRWVESDGYIPAPGDIIMYDWGDSGKGDNSGNPDHVGIVESVSNGRIIVIEGNYSKMVKRRSLAVNGKYIRGYCLPDYASKATTTKTEDKDMQIPTLRKGSKGDTVKAMQTLLENEFVAKKKWIDGEEFLDMVAIAESTPGPIAINAATYIGYRLAGFWGSLAATVGVCIPSFVIIFGISLFFDAFLSLTLVANAFRGIQVCVIYLIFSAGLKMFRGMKRTPFNLTVFFGTVGVMVAVSVFAVSFSAVWCVLLCGAIGVMIYLVGLLRRGKGEGK